MMKLTEIKTLTKKQLFKKYLQEQKTDCVDCKYDAMFQNGDQIDWDHDFMINTLIPYLESKEGADTFVWDEKTTDRQGYLTPRTLIKIVDATNQLDDKNEHLKWVTKREKRLTGDEVDAWEKYTDAGYDVDNLPEGWDKRLAIDYQLNIWDKLVTISNEIQTFWQNLGTAGSNAQKLFKSKGVQGPWYGLDNSALARDLWWKKYGSKEFLRAKAVGKAENNLKLKDHEKQAINVMNALRYGNDSIYEEITELVNHTVYWEITHPIFEIALSFSADPEFDVETN